MATKYLTPFAPAVAQVATATFATYDATTTRKITINGVTFGLLDSGGTLTAALAAFATYLNTSTAGYPSADPYFAAITWTSNATQIIGTADVAGSPFVFAGSVSGGTGTLSNAYTVTTVSSGPNDWSTAANYSDGALPSNGDTLIIRAFSVNMTQGCSALSAVTLAELRIDPSYTGNIGMDYTQFATSADGKMLSAVRPEYRETNFQIGATIANLNSGGQRLCINLGTAASTVNVLGTAGSAPAAEANRGAPPLRILCVNTATVIHVRSGILGVAYEKPGEVSTVATINVADQSGRSQVFTGRGITFNTSFISQSGTHTIESNQTMPLITANGGTVTIEGAGAVTTLNINSGTVNANSSGTITTANAWTGGTLNMQGNSVARTVSTLNWNGATLMIDFAVVTVTAWSLRPAFTDKVATLTMK